MTREEKPWRPGELPAGHGAFLPRCELLTQHITRKMLDAAHACGRWP